MGNKPKRNPSRIGPIIKIITEIWHYHPDLRLLQLLMAVSLEFYGDLFYLEDDTLYEYLVEYKKKLMGAGDDNG